MGSASSIRRGPPIRPYPAAENPVRIPQEVRIYTLRGCKYCSWAKALLREKGIRFVEIDVTGDQEARAKVAEVSGGRETVPQIFIGETHIGGYEELEALNSQGKLAELVG